MSTSDFCFIIISPNDAVLNGKLCTRNVFEQQYDPLPLTSASVKFLTNLFHFPAI